ncbi:DEAD-domain-containing protein [Dentipellis sp. KUC8613]|nr:DEAD-domain-containing protein [Dentipellis sp. KUC8613]
MDDGLVLNLAVDDDFQTSSKAGSSKKGGRWTDRLKAKRTVKRKAERSAPASRAGADEQIDARPAKRPRTSTAAAVPVSATATDRTAQKQTRPPGQIISSLFSYNPKIEQPASTPSAPSAPAKPSNAPLTDSSTFPGLGLDPLITAHLEDKMNIHKPTSIQRAALPAILDPENIERDIFLQAQTGSGKTLAFLLPILQDLLPLCSHSYIDRSIGTLAVILAPTRELATQTADVLGKLLALRLRGKDETPDDEAAARRTRWLVSGLLTGGATRGHEKARLRKGVPILVATPGRLLDHLQNTESFNVGKCRWLVLDEADRLMELGFEDTIRGILQGLDGRRRLALQAVKEGRSVDVGGWDWERGRRTVLCSATMREDVQKLAGTTLVNPIVIKATEIDTPVVPSSSEAAAPAVAEAALASGEKFTPPSQLKQKYTIVPLKLRLVTLVALLRSLISQNQGRRGSKIIVFLSCTDSVDFHWRLLAGASMGEDEDAVSDSEADDDDDSDDEQKKRKEKLLSEEKVEATSPLLPGASIFRLHGSLPLATRLRSLKGFSAVPSTKPGQAKGSAPEASILFCTSVASRGLDLPLVRAVVQYDLPTEGGATEYVHRVGRTARAGKGGEAWSIVAPSEAEWVKWVEDRMSGDVKDGEKQSIKMESVPSDEILRKGFGGKGAECEQRATEVQLAFERWTLRDKTNAGLARKAFQSHMRAYATHPSDEKHIFHIRHLHIGHLAKAFALREAPSSVSASASKSKAGKPKPKGKPAQKEKPHTAKHRTQDHSEEHDADAERRMRDAVRAQGKLSKKGGVMMNSGTSEFQLASTAALERMLNRT